MKKVKDILFNLRQESTYPADEYGADMIEDYEKDADQALKELKELMPSVLDMKKLVVETENDYANAFEKNKANGTRVSAVVEAIHKLINERLG